MTTVSTHVDQVFAHADNTHITDDQLHAALTEAGDQVIYFVQEANHGPIKIGLTTNNRLRARISVIQTGNPMKLSLLGTAPGTRRTEQQLHALFAHAHIRGEWFHPDEQLVQVATASVTRT